MKKTSYFLLLMSAMLYQPILVAQSHNQFVYGLGERELLDTANGTINIYIGGVSYAFNQSGNKFFPINDHLYSKIALIDSNNQLCTNYSYSVYGEPTILTQFDCKEAPEANIVNSVFSSHEYDTFSGLYFSSAREYLPQFTRFLSPDPNRGAGSGSPYTYASNNPVNFIDRAGKISDEFLGDWNKWMSRLENGVISTDNLPREATTFSSEVTRSAIEGHNVLMGEHRGRMFSLAERAALGIYTHDSWPLHQLTRRNIDSFQADVGFGKQVFDRKILSNLDSALVRIPGREGGTTYRGAMAFKTEYHNNSTLPVADGNNVIGVGDFVSNIETLSSSLSRTTAAEFVMRQRYSREFDPSTVLFEITGNEGRNIEAFAHLSQAEVVYRINSVFQVEDVTAMQYGTRVTLRQVTREAAEGRPIYNYLTGEELSSPVRVGEFE